ncbi:RNA binding fox-1-like protein 2 [Rhinolophus ferrumequinum]|uniref:RNA binding fox-1-like protein 2 n=1 Tax=Rhinolophus ferrumequinum TaxID=59479 RepID=A0A7J7WSJ0_RHIFE|nr:RNA binding fox-1-like protein 2 [Rhinolophus ferrumequinum]
MCVSVFVSVPVSVGLRVGGCVSVRPPMGRGICKVSSLFSCRADMQPTDMHSPQLRPQPRLLQPLPPHTVTVMAGCTQLTPTMPLPLPLAMELALWRVYTEVATADLPPTEVT